MYVYYYDNITLVKEVLDVFSTKTKEKLTKITTIHHQEILHIVNQIQAHDPQFQGGYNFRSISKSALAVTRTLMGEPPDRLFAPSASKPAVHTVRKTALIQSKYWKCMYPKGISKLDPNPN